MSRTSTTIPATPPAGPGLNYTQLRARGVALSQQMSGNLWTDYNASDPGVTLLEQLCYALTDLSYRAGFSVPDLLANPGTGSVALRRAGLYPARSMLPAEPATQNDLRRLLLDRVSGLRNVWFVRCRTKDVGGVNGLYDIYLLVPDAVPGCDAAASPTAEILENAKAVYHAHRALCEDVHSISALAPVSAAINASVQLDDGEDASEVLARICFRLALTLMPEPERGSLADQLAAGRTTAEIFDGPLMLRGFIAGDQLGPLPGNVGVASLQRVVSETEGVSTVSGMTVSLKCGRDVYRPGDTIPVDAGTCLKPSCRLETGGFSIKLFRGTTECVPDPIRVTWYLDGLQAARRRTENLWKEYSEQFPAVAGRRLELASYQSVQNLLPDTYGVNSGGLPAEATAARRGLAKQLKGYLMPFDQLLANYASQLAFLRTLFSVSAGGDRTYASQSLDGIVPDATPLLVEDYVKKMQALVAATDPVTERQSAIVGLMQSLYASQCPDAAEAGCRNADDTTISRARLLAGQNVLRNLPRLSARRGMGMNCLLDPSTDVLTALEMRIGIGLGVVDAVADLDTGPEIVSDPADVSIGSPATEAQTLRIEKSFLALGTQDVTANAATGGDGKTLLSGACVTDALLCGLSDIQNYRVGTAQTGSLMALACRDSDGDWWLLGNYAGVVDATAAAGNLVQAALEQTREVRIVEMCLLRGGKSAEADGSALSFRAFVVMSVRSQEIACDLWRSRARGLVRRSLPAHIVPHCVFLCAADFSVFLTLYRAWRAALRQDASASGEASQKLQTYLASCTSDTTGG